MAKNQPQRSALGIHHRVREAYARYMSKLRVFKISRPKLIDLRDMDGDAIRSHIRAYVIDCEQQQSALRRERDKKSDLGEGAWRVGSSSNAKRPLMIMVIGLGTLFFGYLLLFGDSDFKFDYALIRERVPDNLLIAVLSTPIAYVLWVFRDSNAQQQIENQRKDVNLKDFQRLSEWASGQHLVEDKVITTQTGTTENTSRESWVPTHQQPRSHKRRGAEALQVAAVYQLRGFLDGAFGHQFRYPTFQLLLTLWDSLIPEYVKDHPGPWDAPNPEAEYSLDSALNDWLLVPHSISYSAYARAINEVLVADNGAAIAAHASGLTALTFTALNTQGVPLHLARYDLSRSNWRGARLMRAQLQGTRFSNALLRGCDLERADLAGAYLDDAELVEVSATQALMPGLRATGLNALQIQANGAIFDGAQLQHAQFSSGYFQHTSFRQANLQGANFSRANLIGADFCGACLVDVELDDFTFLTDAYYDDKTRFGKTKSPTSNIVVNADDARDRWRSRGAKHIDEIPQERIAAYRKRYDIRLRKQKETYRNGAEMTPAV